MESSLLGLVLDSSVLIAAERRKLTAEQAIETVQSAVGELHLVLCSLTIAEIGHGMYRVDGTELRNRRLAFLRRLGSDDPCPSGHERDG